MAEVRARTEGRGVDAVLVAVAHPAVVVEGLAAASSGRKSALVCRQ